MSDDRLDQVLSLDDPTVIDGGVALAFTLTTTAGEARVCVSQADLGRVIAFFAISAKAMGEAFSSANPLHAEIVNDVPTIPISGLGLREGETPDTSRLVVNLAGFGLAFQIPSIQLAAGLRRLAQTAETLSARGRPQ